MSGIPEREDAGGEAPVRHAQSLRQPLELARAVERRIHQDQPAPLTRREVRLQRLIAVGVLHHNAPVVGEQRTELLAVLDIQLGQHDTICVAQQALRNAWRAGIAP